jgi:hypothetical protein
MSHEFSPCPLNPRDKEIVEDFLTTRANVEQLSQELGERPLLQKLFHSAELRKTLKSQERRLGAFATGHFANALSSENIAAYEEWFNQFGDENLGNNAAAKADIPVIEND